MLPNPTIYAPQARTNIQGITQYRPEYYIQILDEGYLPIDLPLKHYDENRQLTHITAVKELKSDESGNFDLDMSIFPGNYYIRVFIKTPFQFIHFNQSLSYSPI